MLSKVGVEAQSFDSGGLDSASLRAKCFRHTSTCDKWNFHGMEMVS